MLEHHPGGLSTETDSGPLPERPLLAPWLRRAESADGALLLEYADEIVAVDGDASVLKLLDGTRTLGELDPVERSAVAVLASEGVVVPGPAVADAEALREAALGRLAPSLVARRLATARIALAGTSPVAEELARLLPGSVRRTGWDEPVDAELAVAAPDPRELPELAGWNERSLDAGLTWLLTLPFNGRLACIGPLFVPGETCCYRCFVRRRASALPDPADMLALERTPATYPLGRSIAATLAGLAAAAAARWLGRRDGSIAGAFFALELDDGPSVTRHRVLRVPRCEACSPARGEPPLLPWASGIRR